MSGYYYVLSALPPLALGVKPELSFKEVREMLALNLSAKDLHEVERLLRPIDLYNIRALWLGLPLDDKGNYNSRDLEEVLLVQGPLPPYLIDFLERYESTEDRLRYFSSLYASLYREEQVKFTGFLRKYYQFERELRLILTALRAKQAGRDIVRELQFEDPLDPFVAQILAQKDVAEYTPPREYEDLKTLFMENRSDPKKLYRAILQYRFDKIEEMEEVPDFGIDSILAYLAKLILVESWAQLDREKGTTAVEQLSQYG
ncbi:MAG TPA: DUF2764 family protein [Chlamydiales bacterium]|nr:DUF2764 family protein [Chlamydiales bacterium]